jgi:hypothetical protein
MSLGKLLTSGKCLVGLSDNEGRYEMRSKNLLPKFGSAKNPFTNAKPQALAAEVERRLPTESRALNSAETEAMKLKETKLLPAVTEIKTIPAVTTGVAMKPNIGSWLGKLLRKANPMSWRGDRKSEKTLSQPDKTPIQTELSLEKIKVVRNDLTDADLEVVPVKISVKPKPEPPAQPASLPDKVAELIKS